ncbi:phosphatase PAP2 family protein [Bacteroides sp. 519]|uniref:phosphatase PAP2 family protein n=1 Tax=Bacteroides sp. 519 TaxID=2302937 RepID=UPI0013D313CE|nr:phosphatase PAP2 family protein [Bacteroides sp. 519]NDV59155.1 phosphatase PAP2 family protein [Bacteroides sp. 519]
MLENILDYERSLFLMLNGSDSAFLDRVMYVYSGKAIWIPVAIFIAIILLYKKGWRECLFIVIALALVVTLCDQFASGICKPLFTRYRPTHHPEFKDCVETVFGYRGGRFGFISSHAANAFGFATFMVFMFKNTLFSWVIYLWAGITAYSRIYLGVHFISDIVPGIVVGLIIGYCVYLFYKWSRQRFLANQINEENRTQVAAVTYTAFQKRLVVYGILVTILILLVFNVTLAELMRK